MSDYSSGKSFLRFGTKALNPSKTKLKKGNIDEGVRLFANGVLGEGGYENLPVDDQQKLIDNGIALKEELLGKEFSDFSREKASELNIPTMLVYGEESPKFFHAISDRLYNLVHNCIQTNIPDASHDAHLGNPSIYNEEVLEFISQHD